MAVAKVEVSVKRVHCIPKLESSHSKSRSKLRNNPVKELINKVAG